MSLVSAPARRLLTLLPLAAALPWAVAGCEAHPPAPAQAEAAVRRFFTALPAGDCGVLEGMLALEHPGRGCAEVVAEMNQHHLRLREVVDAKVDGRDAHAVIVRARVEQDGKARDAPMLLRVEQRAGGWKLRM